MVKQRRNTLNMALLNRSQSHDTFLLKQETSRTVNTLHAFRSHILMVAFAKNKLLAVSVMF